MGHSLTALAVFQISLPPRKQILRYQRMVRYPSSLYHLSVCRSSRE